MKTEKARIAAALALLDDPKPGLRVEGEGLSVEVSRSSTLRLHAQWPSGACLAYADALPILRHAVKGGAKVVSPVSVPTEDV